MVQSIDSLRSTPPIWSTYLAMYRKEVMEFYGTIKSGTVYEKGGVVDHSGHLDWQLVKQQSHPRLARLPVVASSGSKRFVMRMTCKMRWREFVDGVVCHVTKLH